MTPKTPELEVLSELVRFQERAKENPVKYAKLKRRFGREKQIHSKVFSFFWGGREAIW